MFNREKEWVDFSKLVRDHIVNYTIPQYGDGPNDSAETWTVGECLTSIKKYCNRYGSNIREGQQELDFKKIAHYCCMAYWKYKNLNKDEEMILISKSEYEKLKSLGN